MTDLKPVQLTRWVGEAVKDQGIEKRGSLVHHSDSREATLLPSLPAESAVASLVGELLSGDSIITPRSGGKSSSPQNKMSLRLSSTPAPQASGGGHSS